MEKIPNSPERPRQEKNDILDRIEKELNIPDIKEKLVGVSNTDFQSLFLEIMEGKSKKMGIKEINSTMENNPYVSPSDVPQLDFIKFDFEAYGLLPENYKSVELSPLVPFGTNFVLADINQKKILSTTRGSEVISDPTTALALQCAKERTEKVKRDPKNSDSVDLATSERVIRQNKLKKSGQKQHFKTFSLMSAGRDVGFEKFEKDKLKEQLTFLLKLFKKFNNSGEYDINEITVSFSDATGNQQTIDMVGKPVFEELSKLFSDVSFSFDLERRSNYYKSLCFIVNAKNKEGESFSIAGGGMTDWTEKLVGSKKERLLFSSVGSEILCGYFKI